MAPIDNVVIDWSGTLVDDLDGVLASVNYVLRAGGVKAMSREEFRKAFFLPVDAFYARWLPTVPFDQIRKIYVCHYERNVAPAVAQTGAPELVDQLDRQKVKMYILSTVPNRHFDRQAPAFSFLAKMTRVYTDIQNKETGLRWLLRENGLDPKRTAVIGDMVYDVEVARRCGAVSIAVSNGYTEAAQLALAGPEHLCEDLRSVAGILGDAGIS